MAGGHSLRSGYTPELNGAKVYLWDGDDYALAVTERLGLEDSGGMLRVGPGRMHLQTRAFSTKFTIYPQGGSYPPWSVLSSFSPDSLLAIVRQYIGGRLLYAAS